MNCKSFDKKIEQSLSKSSVIMIIIGESHKQGECNMKLNEFKKCYKQASKLTKQIFYLPILKDDEWHITQYLNGQEKNMTETQFKDFIKIQTQSNNNA